MIKRTDKSTEAFIEGPHAKAWEVAAWVRGYKCTMESFATGAAAIRWAHEQGATRMEIVGIPPAARAAQGLTDRRD